MTTQSNSNTATPYFTFSDFLHLHFKGKVQKIAVNAGFTCPNRDGTKGTGGCTYCNNQTFNPGYCKPEQSVTEQLEQGKRFFARKYPQMQYIAYFQAYTNTYGDIASVIALYEEALRVDGVVGLIIGTRPDCMPQELLEYLSELSKRTFVLVEYGVESVHDRTLRLINRGHTHADTVDAILRTHGAGVMCGVHIIMGLPEETEEEMLDTVRVLSELPISTLKVHQLQIIRGTRLAEQIETGGVKVKAFSVEGYIDLCCRIVGIVPRHIAIERFVSSSPKELLLSPQWGLKNYEFTNLLNNALRKTLLD